ncbi:MAG: hypothetical protein ACKVU2_12430, partial [Saprospiraceae bacterium]
FDMSAMKSMMDMFKSMGEDTQEKGGEQDSSDEAPDMGAAPEPDVTKMGSDMSKVSALLRGIPGLTNVKEINDTTSFNFGYSFDFADVAALNKAMKAIGKDKYESDVDEFFRFKNGNFERLEAGDIGKELEKAISSSEGAAEGPVMDPDMLKSLFGDVSYKQVYHFPDSKVKKSTNALSEISNEEHTVTITLKPFDEEMMKKNPKLGTTVKLK